MKVDYDLYYKDSGSVNKGHDVESNVSVSISLSHDYTTVSMGHLFKRDHQSKTTGFISASNLVKLGLWKYTKVFFVCTTCTHLV